VGDRANEAPNRSQPVYKPIVVVAVAGTFPAASFSKMNTFLTVDAPTATVVAESTTAVPKPPWPVYPVIEVEAELGYPEAMSGETSIKAPEEASAVE